MYFLAKDPILGSRQAMARAEQAAYSERRTMGQRYEAVLKAAETGSFKEAARELGYTQAGVSYAVGALERELGVSLFVRELRRRAPHRRRRGAPALDAGRLQCGTAPGR